jgi:predicted nuclease with TOPRIM domain
MLLLQSMPDFGTTASNVTVIGLLLTAVIALYLGHVTPKHTVEELRVRLKERDAENTVLNADVVRRIEENAELRGELAAMRRELEGARAELASLRGEVASLRTELGRYRAGTA